MITDEGLKKLIVNLDALQKKLTLIFQKINRMLV